MSDVTDRPQRSDTRVAAGRADCWSPRDYVLGGAFCPAELLPAALDELRHTVGANAALLLVASSRGLLRTLCGCVADGHDGNVITEFLRTGPKAPSDTGQTDPAPPPARRAAALGRRHHHWDCLCGSKRGTRGCARRARASRRLGARPGPDSNGHDDPRDRSAGKRPSRRVVTAMTGQLPSAAKSNCSISLQWRAQPRTPACTAIPQSWPE